MAEDNQLSLNAALQCARMDLIRSTTMIMNKYHLSAAVAEGVLCAVLSDLRAQTALDIAVETETLLLKLSEDNKPNEPKEMNSE